MDVTAIFAATAAFFNWLTGRQSTANDPAMKKNKIAQVEQDESDRIQRLVRTATSDPDPTKRESAASELRKLNSE